jgi:hypothetical protein
VRSPLLALAVLAVSLLAGCHEPAEVRCPGMMDWEWDQPGLYEVFPDSAEGFRIEARAAQGHPFEHPTHGFIGLTAVQWYKTFGGFTQPIYFAAADNMTRPKDEVVLELVAGADDDWVRSVFIAFVANLTDVQAATQHAWADSFVASREPGGPLPVLRTRFDPGPATDKFHVAIHGPYRFEEHHRAAAPEESLRGLMVMTTTNVELTNDWTYGFDLAKKSARTIGGNHTARLSVNQHDEVQFHISLKEPRTPNALEFHTMLEETLERLDIPYPENLAPLGSTC